MADWRSGSSAGLVVRSGAGLMVRSGALALDCWCALGRDGGALSACGDPRPLLGGPAGARAAPSARRGFQGELLEEELLELRVFLDLRAPPACGVFLGTRGLPGPLGAPAVTGASRVRVSSN